MSIQGLVKQIKSLTNRYYICRYIKTFKDHNIKLYLEILNDEAEYIKKLEVENPDLFDPLTRSNRCVVDIDYFSNHLNELERQIIGSIDKVKVFEENDSSFIKQIDSIFKDKLIVIQPQFNANNSKNYITKKGIVNSVISNVKNPNGFITIPIIPNQGEFRKFTKNDYFLIQPFQYQLEGTPDYIYHKKQIYSVNLTKSTSSTYLWKNASEDQYTLIDVDIDKMYKEYNLFKSDHYIYISKDFLVSPNESKQEEIKDVVEVKYNESIKEDTLEDLYNYIKASNLCYDINDIYNFYSCVCSGQLIVLAGMSGTGKTKLPLKFAEYFNMTEENNTLLFMPISPSYTEPSDVLGYLNPNTSMYIPSETRLSEFLVHAQENKDKMHMIIFDEMNLSQIEYWFAPFISLLEKDIDERTLYLYSDKVECNNSEQFPSKINIGRNIIFIGTVNLDETTKNISDRLIDRSFIINLKKESFMNYMNQSKISDNLNKYNGIDFIELVPDNKEINKNYISIFDDIELKFFDEIHEALNQAAPQKGISFRVVKNIALFMSHKSEKISRSQAFDYAFKQTILKKINGTIDSMGEFIGTEVDQQGDTNGILCDILNRYSSISDFTNSKKEISCKALELRKYGYTK